MNYNFTDRVRRVLAMAREEAIRLQHDRIGPEHILLGIVREEEGVAVAVLTDLSAGPDQIRERVEESVQRGNSAVLVEVPYTSRAKKVLEAAMAEARELKHSYVGTEHLLLGLLHEETGIAAEVLKQLGVTLEQARHQTLKLLGALPDRVSSQEMARGEGPGSALDEGKGGRSVHSQISEPVVEAVTTGVLRPGDPLPTIRQLADKLEIAPEIVAKAYEDLERQGLITTDPQGDVRIANRPPTPAPGFKPSESLVELLRPIVVTAFHLAATKPELRDALEDAMEEIFDSPERNA